MQKCLEKFNFGKTFIKWIEILYTDPVMVVKNNGYFTKKITISRGLRQGCPVSSLLFILIAEILAIKIRNNNDIKGILVQDSILKISQYADDMTLILSDFQSISASIKAISEFSKVAGPKININKTEGLFIGTSQHCDITNYTGIKMNKTSAKYYIFI